MRENRTIQEGCVMSSDVGQKILYGGLSGAELPVESFDLSGGIALRRTYAHLMSPSLMAFALPGPEGYHPPPWKATRGGFSCDITIELCVPERHKSTDMFGAVETIRLIAAMFRLAKTPSLSVPVLSNQPFGDVPASDTDPVLRPFETETRMFEPSEAENRILDMVVLEWVEHNWLLVKSLLEDNPRFNAAFRAFDSASISGRASASLLALWGGIEQLFSPSPGELRFRVASLMASYMEPMGPARRDLFRKLMGLYNERSLAVHTAQDTEAGPLLETYVLLRNALVRIIDDGKVPTQTDLEALLFGCDGI